MAKEMQCTNCGLVVKGKKKRKAHDQVCSRAKPAPKQHFVFFNLPRSVTSWYIRTGED